MRSSGFATGFLIFSLLAPLAAQAEGRCVLSEWDSIETQHPKAILILADHLDLAYGAKERVFESNDGTTRLEIQRTASRLSNSDLRATVLVKGTPAFQAIGQSNGDTMGIQATAALADGRTLSLTCTAQPH
jgi:hypothetical protein